MTTSAAVGFTVLRGLHWLITGGCGFIGTRLVAALRKHDAACAIRVFDNLSVGSMAGISGIPGFHVVEHARPASLAAGELQFVRGEVCDVEAMHDIASGIDIFVHLAANTGVGPSVANPRADCLTNVLGTLNALDAARLGGTKRFIFASSGAPVGEAVPPIHEEIVPHPVSPYGASKLAGEAYCSAYWRSYGLETVALRFGNVYGPGSWHKSSVVAKFVRDAMSTGELRINGDGSQTRDFIFVDDLVRAIFAAAGTTNIGGEVFQIATERETSITEIVELLCVRLPSFGLPSPRIAYDRLRVGDVLRNFSNTRKAWQRMGWRATTTLETGIDDTIRWFLESAVK